MATSTSTEAQSTCTTHFFWYSKASSHTRTFQGILDLHDEVYAEYDVVDYGAAEGQRVEVAGHLAEDLEVGGHVALHGIGIVVHYVNWAILAVAK